MSPLAWLLWVALAAAAVYVIWATHADLREDRQHRADLDETNAAIDELRAYTNELRDFVAHLADHLSGVDDEQPSTGRHAHSGEIRMTYIDTTGGPRT